MISKANLEFVGKATAVVALLFTVFTYAYNQKLDIDRNRYTASIDLMYRYRTDGVRAAETTLDQRLLYYMAGGKDPNDPEVYTDRLFDALAKEVLFGFTGTPGQTVRPLLPELFQIADFYGEVGFCIQHQMCDADILRSHFCPRAARFKVGRARLIDYYTSYSSSGVWFDGMEEFMALCL